VNLKQIRWKRLIWTVLVSFYFINFFKNLFNDALPGHSWLAFTFFVCFTIWMALEYYFGSPFFQSGIIETPQLWRSLFALFYYPFLGYCVADYAWTKWAQVPVLSPYLNILGILAFILGSYVRLASLFSALRSPANKLVRKGFFSMVRHPRYLGTLIQVVAVPLAFSTWLGLVLALAIGLPLMLVEIHAEESGLLDAYKDEYAAYRLAVPALIPGRRPVPGK
jgi:protein-S-isoprenylcysteine O-methyltransferase Ste14